MSPARAQEIASGFDLRALPADFYADPYPVYDLLREHDPVRRMPDGSWFLTRYADLVAVYRDARTFSSDKKVEFAPKYLHQPWHGDVARAGDAPLFAHHTSSLVFNDPPLHTRVRKLIMVALTRRAIREMEGGLITLVDQLLDRIAERGGGDLIADFASAIPVEVIGNLLGVPHADRAPLRGWSLAILGALEPALTPEQEALGNRSVSEFLEYLKLLVADRRRHPGDPEHDVLTRLILGEADSDGPSSGRLSEAELLHNCIFILNAGHETTTNLIGNALVCLQQWPDARVGLLARMQRYRDDAPALEQHMDSAVDEFLRFESSNQLGNRRATTACQVGGVDLPAGALVTLCIGAANRDPAQFPQADRFDLMRRDNRHLAFGFGIHQCAGLSLARLEGRIAIGRFLQRFPDYRLTQAPLRGARARFRGFLNASFTVA
ncbi:MAG: cytochrome P450 [Rhodoferax sp.]|nr:cytochrome P450 [Rhodoferax sp.]